MRLENLTQQDRTSLSLPKGRMALRVDYVGQWGKYALAKRSGFKKGDLVISFDGQEEMWKEQDVFFHVLKSKNKGDEIPVTVIRDGRNLKLKLPVQD